MSTALGRLEFRKAFAACIAGALPDDPAWAKFAPKLARHFIDFETHDDLSAYGNPRPKGRMELRTDKAAWDALAHVAEDWPGQPLGMTSSAVLLTLRDLAEGLADA